MADEVLSFLPEPDTLTRACRVVDTYRFVVREEDGRFCGWPLELPDAVNHGETPDACVRAVRASAVARVVRCLRAGGSPPQGGRVDGPTEWVGVPFSRAEFELIEQAARERGCATAAEWVRRTSLTVAGVRVPPGQMKRTPGPVQKPPDERQFREEVVAVQGLVVAGWVASSAVVFLVNFAHVSSLMFTAPAALLLGATLVRQSARIGYAAAVWCGVANCVACTLLFASPIYADGTDAGLAKVATMIGTAHVLLSTPLCLLALRHPPKWADPATCATCGYLLYGLTEPRCPECGTGFDPRRVGSA